MPHISSKDPEIPLDTQRKLTREITRRLRVVPS